MPYLLALNCGSSSLKSTLFAYPDISRVVCSVSASSIGSPQASLKVKANETQNQGKQPRSRSVKGESHDKIFGDVLEELRKLDVKEEEIHIVTHRIVHGGTFDEPVVVTKDHSEALQKMEELSAFAPLHNHHAVLTVKAVLDQLPKAKNLLCFDTLFHKSLPAHIYTYPIKQPEHAPPVPLRRYGFHGLSYASILSKAARFLNKAEKDTSLIICHLGSGASMCCVRDGKSYDTTMGLTPLEGLPGGTRSGSLDPSLVFHLFPDPSRSGKLVETKGMSLADGELILNKSSGFQGLCGTSEYGEIQAKADEQRESGTTADSEQGKERLCTEIFENRILNYVGSYLVPLKGRPDAIVFSGGIGEKSDALRASILGQLEYLGIQVDEKSNKEAGGSDDDVVEISSNDSKIKALRVLTDEESVCAKMALETFKDKKPGGDSAPM